MGKISGLCETTPVDLRVSSASSTSRLISMGLKIGLIAQGGVGSSRGAEEPRSGGEKKSRVKKESRVVS